MDEKEREELKEKLKDICGNQCVEGFEYASIDAMLAIFEPLLAEKDKEIARLAHIEDLWSRENAIMKAAIERATKMLMDALTYKDKHGNTKRAYNELMDAEEQVIAMEVNESARR